MYEGQLLKHTCDPYNVRCACWKLLRPVTNSVSQVSKTLDELGRSLQLIYGSTCIIFSRLSVTLVKALEFRLCANRLPYCCQGRPTRPSTDSFSACHGRVY